MRRNEAARGQRASAAISTLLEETKLPGACAAISTLLEEMKQPGPSRMRSN